MPVVPLLQCLQKEVLKRCSHQSNNTSDTQHLIQADVSLDTLLAQVARPTRLQRAASLEVWKCSWSVCETFVHWMTLALCFVKLRVGSLQTSVTINSTRSPIT